MCWVGDAHCAHMCAIQHICATHPYTPTDVASLQPGGRAWTHVVNVRLMHARVRVALTKKASSRTPDGGDVHANGGGDVHANGGNAATAAAGAYDPGDVKDASRYDRQRDGLAINQVHVFCVVYILLTPTSPSNTVLMHA